MIKRWLKLPSAGSKTFFLWGPRQTGKTTLLKETFPDALRVDLLKADVFRRYLSHPETLRQEISTLARRPFVVIDEIQKLPALLDEVHVMHEEMGVRFALCGSSARKLKRGGANLLGGRALRFELHGLVSAELGEDWDLVTMLNRGFLPSVHLSDDPVPLIEAYVADYLKEEVAAEGLVRNLPVFSEFLNIAALSDTELVNFSTIARECGVASLTVKGYYEILNDTLLGRWLPAYTRRPKRRVIGASKFYFCDVGLVNFLAKRGAVSPGGELFGKAFENWCHHELVAYNVYARRSEELHYWRTAAGAEVDFIVGGMKVAIEAKSARAVNSDHLKGLRALTRLPTFAPAIPVISRG
ncbi:MAG: ATP-binding protein [Deltaproteobacteria bacterium]|nr:ATP-binding protein [Deltaproteobacteria bacterium]